MTQRHTNPVANVTVAGTPEQTARGACLVSAFPGCAGCHAPDPTAERPVLDGKLDEDLAALATLYIPYLPPGDTPPPSLTLLGTELVGTGTFPLANQPPVQTVTAPTRGPTIEYGSHPAQASSCATCHGPRLDGADIEPRPPAGPSLRLVKGWTVDQFIQTMREGVSPAGRQLANTMPWRQYGRGTDDDLRALYVYLRSLP